MTTATERIADADPNEVGSDADRMLRSAADLVARSISLGALIAAAAFLLGLAWPLLFLIGPFWLVLLPAAAAGGVGAAAAMVAARALGWGARAERIAVPAGAAVLGAPMLVALQFAFGSTVGVSWWLWFPAAVFVPAFAHPRALRAQVDAWRPVLGLAIRSGTSPVEPAPEPAPVAEQPPAPGAWSDPETGHAGDRPRPGVSMPSVEEGRRQFAVLAAATMEAAGPGAIWRDSPGVAVLEAACEGGIREPIFGGAALGAIDFAKIDFAFGVAQPRVEGRCLPAR